MKSGHYHHKKAVSADAFMKNILPGIPVNQRTYAFATVKKETEFMVHSSVPQLQPKGPYSLREAFKIGQLITADIDRGKSHRMVVRGSFGTFGPPTLNRYAAHCRVAADRFYRNPKTGRRVKVPDSTRYALMHAELSEAFEGLRKDTMDSHLPHRKEEEVELADLLIRVFDYAGHKGLDLDGAVAEKLVYNQTRKDHSNKARLKKNGKKFLRKRR